MPVANRRVRRKSFAHCVIVGPGYGASGGVLARKWKQFGCLTQSVCCCVTEFFSFFFLQARWVLNVGWRLPLAEVDL
jgi:hypothetical protein